MTDKKVYRPVLVGCVITGEDAAKLDEMCSPHSASDVIEAFIHSIVSGDVTITKTKKELTK